MKITNLPKIFNRFGENVKNAGETEICGGKAVGLHCVKGGRGGILWCLMDIPTCYTM
jgi:hypothetical protein